MQVAPRAGAHMTVTAESITDQQIFDLRRELARERRDPNHPNFDRSRGLFGLGEVAVCIDANNPTLHPDHVKAQRARCAEIWNARAKEAK